MQWRLHPGCCISITRIDGLNANYDASSSGDNWPFKAKRLYLSPESHALEINISQIEALSAVGYYTTNENHTIKVEFKANHVYQFTAGLGLNKVGLDLWDATEGTAKRSIVTSWVWDSQRNFIAEPTQDAN
jgi:hypothetical protein